MRRTDQFERSFWSGADLGTLYQAAASSRHNAGSMERIFESGFREFVKLRKQTGTNLRVLMDGTRRAMRATYQREMDHLESHLSFLATVGSVSPVRRPVRHGVGHHECVPRAGQRAARPRWRSGAGHRRSAGRHRHGPVRGDSRGHCLQPFRRAISNRLSIRFDSFMEEFSNILQRQANSPVVPPASGQAVARRGF